MSADLSRSDWSRQRVGQPMRRLVSWIIGGASVAVLVYSISVLSLVSLSGDIGLRFVLGTAVRDRFDTGDYQWSPVMPELKFEKWMK